jgi:methionyl-tRNA formyltransferase
MMRVVFAGTGEIGLPSLKALFDRAGCEVAGVVTQPDRPAGRDLKLRASAIKEAALARAVRVLQPVRIRDAEAVEELAALAPDVLVVMAHGQILPRAVLDLPRLACLNLHASLLPRHRGAAPIQAAIAAGDSDTGITVMYMDEGLDTGDILLQRTIPIGRRETGGSLHDRLAEIAPEALVEALSLIESGSAPRMPQNPAGATYAPRLTREDGRIDWSAPGRVIKRHVRAMDPWPGAFTDLPMADGGTKRVKVFSAAVGKRGGEPGEVLDAGRRGILVAGGDGSVLLREVQLEARRRMAAAELIRGHRVEIGSSCV